MPFFAVLPIALIALLAYAATRPNTFRVQRSQRIAAPPQVIASHIDDFREWAAWSPYEKLDPAMQRTFSGPTKGVGAVYEWSGNNKAGAGRMEIIEDRPERVAFKLEFTRPMRANNVSTFDLVPEGSETRVTWSMEGPAAYMMKVMGVFMNMDNMIGRDFEAGLGNLKRISEGGDAATRG
jgi:carbon monoxide dehydrogenase subunit G